jgi:hypothetical protein
MSQFFPRLDVLWRPVGDRGEEGGRFLRRHPRGLHHQVEHDLHAVNQNKIFDDGFGTFDLLFTFSAGSGDLGGELRRIVAETFHRAMEGSQVSIVRDPTWRPCGLDRVPPQGCASLGLRCAYNARRHASHSPE